MSGVTIRLIGEEDVIGALYRLGVVGVVRVQTRVNLTALRVQSRAKDLCPVDTGRLRNSIGLRFFRVGSFDKLAAEVYTNTKYAPAVEFGSGLYGEKRAPIIITPRTKQFLRFKVGNRWVFARRVVHPGVRPRPFMIPAWEAERDGFLAGLKADLKTAAA